ncbi:MAG: flagellar basal body rod protein FlgB [Selenomonadaceae bacterium]|nr:flagellar basal body rod protein FlgB [Selenomonadaceae bacterium]
MLEQIVNAPLFDYMERGLAAANLRHEVISNNIANVNTPYFKKSNVVFEELLAKELAPVPTGQLQVVRTHDRHMPIPSHKRAEATIEEDTSSTMRTDHNNVDIDIEMASMAKNQLYFNALSTMLGQHISAIKNVITTAGQSG